MMQKLNGDMNHLGSGRYKSSPFPGAMSVMSNQALLADVLSVMHRRVRALEADPGMVLVNPARDDDNRGSFNILPSMRTFRLFPEFFLKISQISTRQVILKLKFNDILFVDSEFEDQKKDQEILEHILIINLFSLQRYIQINFGKYFDKKDLPNLLINSSLPRGSKPLRSLRGMTDEKILEFGLVFPADNKGKIYGIVCNHVEVIYPVPEQPRP